jgi:hypothetical protein
MARVRRELSGQKFGRLTVMAYVGSSLWRCRCECGVIKSAPANSLTSGRTRSCGCLHREAARITGSTIGVTHGETGTPTYTCWAAMIRRCYNPNAVQYRHYGGRGIKVCTRWKSYVNFRDDMGRKPDGLSLDRIDVDGDYCQENCRWATALMQTRNRRPRVRAPEVDDYLW